MDRAIPTTLNHLERIRSLLGRPAYEDEGVLLYHCDCLEMMDIMPPESVDQTVTSPPYNIGKAYETRMSIDAYCEWMASWISKNFRITKSDGSFWLNLGYVSVDGRAKAIPIPYLIWDRVPFFLMQEIVWNYGAGVAAKKFFSPRNEKFLWYVKDSNSYTFNLDDVRDPNVKYPNQKKNGKLRCNTIGKNPSDVWQIAKVTSGKNRSSPERTPHPAQFPLDLVTRVIKAGSNPGDILLDPFAGSGSLLEAAILTGRQAIGFEIRRDYVDLAIKRLQNLRHKQRMIAPQVELFVTAAE
jgi:adenine-specific DNA-methyltransferase